MIAKAYSLKGHPSAFGLQIEAQYWNELKDVGMRYPYYAEPASGIGLSVPVYPPLVDPGSDSDRILPSGVRQSTWASLIDFHWGWPFRPRHKRWFRETKAYWGDILKDWPEIVTSNDQLPVEGVITVYWRKGLLSR